MCLVEDQRVIAQQAPVPLDLGEQDAVGHQLDQCAVTGLVGKTHRVPHDVTEWGTEFVGDALGDGAGRQPSRLGVADGAAHTPTEFQADLGQLSGFARSRLTGHHHHLMVADRGGEFAAQPADRQVRVGDRRYGSRSGGDECLAGDDLIGELPQLRGVDGGTQRPQPLAQPVSVADRQAIQTRPHGAHVIRGWFRHSRHDRRPGPGSTRRLLWIE